MDRQTGWMAGRPGAGSVGRAAQLLGQRSGKRTGSMAEQPVECSLADSAGRPAHVLAERHAGGTARAPASRAQTRSRKIPPLHELACRQRDASGARAELPEDDWSGRRKDGPAVLAEQLEDVGVAADEDGPLAWGDDDDVDVHTSIPLRGLACKRKDESDVQAELPEDDWSGKLRKDGPGALAEPLAGEDAAAAEDGPSGDDVASRAQTRSRKIPPLCEPACRQRDGPGALAELPEDG